MEGNTKVKVVWTDGVELTFFVDKAKISDDLLFIILEGKSLTYIPIKDIRWFSIKEK